MSTIRRPPGRGLFDRNEDSSDAPDATVVEFLRRTYSAPEDLGYWAALERRVMAGVRAADTMAEPEWWQPFAGWVRMGLAAAGLAAIVAGAALVQSRAAESSAAYAAVLDAPATAPVQAASARDGSRLRGGPGSLSDPQAARRSDSEVEAARAREATLRFVISH